MVMVHANESVFVLSKLGLELFQIQRGGGLFHT